MSVGQIEHAARIAVVDPARSDVLGRQALQYPFKSLGLGAGEAFVEFVALGEVAEGSSKLQPWQRAQSWSPRIHVPPRKPEPVHAGVDLEVDGHRSPSGSAGLREALGHFHGTDTGFEVQFQHVRHLVGQAFPQQQNWGGDAGIPEFLGFSEGEDC